MHIYVCKCDFHLIFYHEFLYFTKYPSEILLMLVKYTIIYDSLCCAVLNHSLVPTLCDPMDCSLPGSSLHGDSPGKNTGVGCHVLLQASSQSMN